MTVPQPGAVDAEATRVQGQFIRDVIAQNPANFRVFSPDETTSNRWNAVFEVTNRCSTGAILPGDDHVAPDGRVMEMLSEHQCEGWLEGTCSRDVTGSSRATKPSFTSSTPCSTSTPSG